MVKAGEARRGEGGGREPGRRPGPGARTWFRWDPAVCSGESGHPRSRGELQGEDQGRRAGRGEGPPAEGWALGGAIRGVESPGQPLDTNAKRVLLGARGGPGKRHS